MQGAGVSVYICEEEKKESLRTHSPAEQGAGFPFQTEG
jgi:hypothetical protein